MSEEYDYKMVLTCESIIVDEDYRICGKKARWLAEWSDRQMIVCDEHKSDAQDAHDNDNEYDQTGVTFTRIVYHDDED